MSHRPLFHPRIEDNLFSSRRLSEVGMPYSPIPVDQWIDLSTNENAFGTAPSVVAAIQQEATTLNLYPTRIAERTLREQLAALHQQGLDANNIVIANSGSSILTLSAEAFLQPGDEVITFTPTFNSFPFAARRQGAHVVELPLSAENEFALNIDRILAAVNERTRMVYLCNPNNPTGNILTAEAYERLLAELPPEIVIVADEVYYQFVDDPRYPNTIKHIQAGRNIIQVFSFSKAYGLAGLRLGYGIMRPRIGAYFAKMQSVFHIGRVTIAAGLAAVAAQDHIEHTAASVIRGRNWLTNQLHELNVKVYPGQGNFLLINPGIPGTRLYERLLEEYGILVADGQWRFGLPDCIRVTVSTPANNQRFIEATTAILASEQS